MNNDNTNNNNNNKISNSYKDYKYVYTGLEDFVKEHHLDKEEIKKEKEIIIHDHRNVFDFNNPNQHYHDYSFDFSQKPTKETPIKETPYKDKYGNIYPQKPKTYQQQSYYNSNYNVKNETIYTNNKNLHLNTKNNLKIIKIIIFIFFILPILITFVPAIISVIYDYSSSNYETVQKEYEPIIEAYAESIENSNYVYLKKYIPTEELNYNGGIYWMNHISTIKYETDYAYIHSLEYDYEERYQISDQTLINIENNYNYMYNIHINIEKAYAIRIDLNINNGETKLIKFVNIGKINDKWYLLSQ